MLAALLLLPACNPGSFDRVDGRAGEGGIERTTDGSAASEATGPDAHVTSAPDAQTEAGLDAGAEPDGGFPDSALQPAPDGAATPDRDAGTLTPDAASTHDGGPSCFAAGKALVDYFRMEGVPTSAVLPPVGATQVVASSVVFDAGRVGSSLHAGELSFAQPRLDAPSALTISAWVQLDAVPDSLNAAWVWKGDDAGEDLSTGYWLVFAGSNFRTENGRYLSGVAAQGHLGLALTDGVDEQFLLTDRPFPLLRPVHVVATFDGTRARLYLDGRIERDEEQRVVTRASSSPVRLASPLGGAIAPLRGQLDEVAFIDRALSPSEVSALYALAGVLCTE